MTERGHRTLSAGVGNMLAATSFFALMNVGAKYLGRLHVGQIAFVRALVTIAIAAWLIRRARISPWGNNKRLLILRGLAGTISLLLYLYTVQVMPLSSAVTIQYLAPIFTVIISGFMLGERAAPRQWLLFAVAFAGVVLVKGPDPRVTSLSLAAGIGSAVLTGVAYSAIRGLRGADDPLVVVFFFPLVALPIVTPLALIAWVSPTWHEWLALGLVGLATAAAQLFMTKAYQAERADRVGMVTYLGTFFAVAFGYLLFDEHLSALSAIGLALIIAGVVLSTRSPESYVPGSPQSQG